MTTRRNVGITGPLAAAMVAAALVMGGGAASAADVRELFLDNARAGELEAGDVGILDLDGSECLLWSKETKKAFCLGFARTDDGAEAWFGVVVDATSGTQGAYRIAVRRSAKEPWSDELVERLALNKALGSKTWSDELYPRESWSLDAGAAPMPSSFEAPGGPAGERADGTVRIGSRSVTVSLLAGHARADVSVYPLPYSEPFVVVVDDQDGDRTAARFLVATGDAGARPAKTAAMPSGEGMGAPCPQGLWCPPNYNALRPLLARFCADDFDVVALAETASLAANDGLAADDLAVLFNAYGALYNYAFVQKTQYNGFFYGTGLARADAAERAWLPAQCRRAVGSYTHATLPSSMRKARDGVKKLWEAHR